MFVEKKERFKEGQEHDRHPQTSEGLFMQDSLPLLHSKGKRVDVKDRL